jgi:transposase
MLRIAYHMLKDGTFYQDRGPDYRGRKNPARAAQNLARRIRALGYDIELKKAA